MLYKKLSDLEVKPEYHYIIFWKNGNKNYVKIWGSGAQIIYDVIEMFSLENFENDIEICVEESQFYNFIIFDKSEFKLIQKEK